MEEMESARRVQIAIFDFGKARVAARATEPPIRPGARIVIRVGVMNEKKEGWGEFSPVVPSVQEFRSRYESRWGDGSCVEDGQ